MAGKAKKDEPDAKAAEDGDAEAAPKKGKLKLIIIIVAALLVLGGGGGGAYMFLFAGGDDKADAAKESDEPVPAFVEIKPFVVTIKSNEGGQHYLQLGMSLKVPTAEAVNAVGTVMPVVLDTMRQTILAYKSDELETGEGVNKLRGSMLVDVNDVLVKSLGTGKIKKLGDDSGKALVQNIFFSSLVIE